MRRIIIATIVVVSLATLFACGGGPTSPPTTPTSTGQPAASDSDTPTTTTANKPAAASTSEQPARPPVPAAIRRYLVSPTTLKFPQLKTGQIGDVPLITIFQVVDGNTAIVRLPVDEDIDHLVMLNGINTSGAADGRSYTYSGPFLVTGTITYSTAIGGQRTIFSLDALPASKIDAYRKQLAAEFAERQKQIAAEKARRLEISEKAAAPKLKTVLDTIAAGGELDEADLFSQFREIANEHADTPSGEIAVREAKALDKLRLTRKLLDDGKKAAPARRLAEIVRDFPNTLGARRAAELLKLNE
jgi:hypothetical protein